MAEVKQSPAASQPAQAKDASVSDPTGTSSAAPEPTKSKSLEAAQAKAPSLTEEFVSQYGLTDDDLAAIARGEVPPPPTVGPIHTVDLHRTPGGWQITPVGVAPEDVGKDAISR